jgi:hypothetical protein
VFRLFGVYGAATVLRRGVLHGSGSFGVVQWAPQLTFANARPELGDRRSCVYDLKTTEAWWSRRGDDLACSGLRRPVLHGNSWLAWDIVGDDGACVVGYFRLLGWWYGVVVLYGVIVCVDVPIRPGIVCLLELRCVACVDVTIRPA